MYIAHIDISIKFIVMANQNHFEFSIKITTLEMDDDDYGIHELNTFDVNHSNINYRAEGNANIVLALPFRCQVLRLSKSKRRINCSGQLPGIFYVYKYIKSASLLFGEHLTSPPTLVRVQFTNRNSFDDWLNNYRPIQRKSTASSNDIHFGYGLLYADAALLNATHGRDTYAIEIKPKQGWHLRQLPDNVLNMFDVERGAAGKCRFCTMQYLKLNEKKIARVGDFCPLDLFSGNFPRLKKALRCLAESPQNNFRIFKNGHLVYTEGNHTNELVRIINEIFLADNDRRKTLDDFATLLGQILLLRTESVEEISAATIAGSPNDCVLDRVLSLQLLASQTMPSIAQKYSNESLLFDALARDDNWPFEHLNKLSQKIDTHASRKFEIDKPFLENTLKLTPDEMYEIGATALDSSIMLTFQRCDGKQIDSNYVGNIITVDGINFIVKSSVFDLDPKLYPKHFVKYIERTKKSYDAWAERSTHQK